MSLVQKYLQHYPIDLQHQVSRLVEEQRLGEVLQQRYPVRQHEIQTDARLYQLTMQLKHSYMKNAGPLSKVVFDNSIHMINALGLHRQTSRVQGGRLKAKSEIRIAAVLKQLPLAILRMVVVHELAHIRESDHNKSFYQLCQHMEPQYHQLELDLRLFLLWIDLSSEKSILNHSVK